MALMASGECKIFESESEPGGHCRSTQSNGFTFDRGPHIIFSRNQKVLSWINTSLAENIHFCERNNWAILGDSLVKYPVENFLGMAGSDVALACLVSFLTARSRVNSPERSAISDGAAPSDLDEWFLQNFGRELTERYFRPYNEKLWELPLARLSMSWADRIPQPPDLDVINGCVGNFREGYTHQLYYSYPLEGGYQAITDAWARSLEFSDRVSLSLGSKVMSLEPSASGVRLRTATEVVDFPFVISTLPLKQLVQLVPDVPSRLVDLGAELIVNPTHVVTLGFKGDLPKNYTAIYDPRADFPANRISFPGVFSPMNVPDGQFSVQFEITEAYDSDRRHDVGLIVENCVEHARDLGVAVGEPVFRHHDWFRDAYVVYDVGYEDRVTELKKWFRDRGIYVHGRFGAHRYVNIDGCVEDTETLLADINLLEDEEEISRRFDPRRRV